MVVYVELRHEEMRGASTFYDNLHTEPQLVLIFHVQRFRKYSYYEV